MQGAAGGFTVVDPGGNWVRITSHDDDADTPDPSEGRLARVVATAARQADSHGEEGAGVRVLENGLARHADAPADQRLPALVYLAELRVRTGDPQGAQVALAEVAGLELSAQQRRSLAAELRTAAELRAGLDG
jgi:ATP/maltotriose-dependent transcriptional regulator MalT